MKHISELTSSTSRTQSAPASINYSEESKQAIKELFVLMKATWGNKYTSNFTSPEDVRLAMRMWLQSFHNTDRSILHQAMEHLALKLEWPPTIHEMSNQIQLLLNEKKAMKSAALRLPASKRTEIGRKAIEQMKEILAR